MLIDHSYSVLHSNITPEALPCLDWPGGNVLSVPRLFLSDVPHAYLKTKMKYQLNLNRIQNLALSSNVALPWLQCHKNSEQKMLINVGKIQI